MSVALNALCSSTPRQQAEINIDTTIAWSDSDADKSAVTTAFQAQVHSKQGDPCGTSDDCSSPASTRYTSTASRRSPMWSRDLN